MYRHHRPLALLLSTSVLTACAVGPEYKPPEATVSTHFLGHDGVASRPAQSKADMQAWWEGFGDPLLTRFVALALEQNLDIAQAAARVAQSRASLRQADATLLPSAAASAQAARAYQSVETPLGQVLDSTPGFDRNGSAYEANVGASWEIDVFGGLQRGREAVRAQYQASEAVSRPRKRRMSTSRSAGCRRASRSLDNKRRRGAGFSRRSSSSTRRASPPSCSCDKPRGRSRRSRRRSRSWKRASNRL